MFPKMQVLIAFLAGAVVIGGLELTFEGGSLLYCMLFFATISMGPMAVIAGADISGGKWVKPYKETMFSVRHMILFVLILFLVFIGLKRHELIYFWAEEGTEFHHTWLEKNFYMLRNVLLLAVSWIVANVYAKASMQEKSSKVFWAIMWVFSFVITQTVIAFDWVMSLEFPWISTLFGAYFFVEAFYCGLAFAAIYTSLRYQHLLEVHDEKTFKKSMMDMMTMFFGFSIFWAYQFFSQYIVIWYGNIPEEVSYFTRRLDEFSGWLYIIPVILFVTPFWILISRKMKANPKVIIWVGLLVWAGILVERFFMLGAHHDIHLSPIITTAEVLVAAGVFFWVVKNQDDTALTADS